MSHTNGHADTLKWRDVSPSRPCPVCEKPDWCRVDTEERLACCKRLERHAIYGAGKAGTDKSGGAYWTFVLKPSPNDTGRCPEPTCSHTDTGGDIAGADQRHNVYSRYLELARLSDEHRKALDTRKYAWLEARKRGLRSLGKDRVTIVAKMIREGMEKLLPGVPGFYLNEKGERKYWSVKAYGGLLIPVRDVAGLILGLLTRSDKSSGGKYLWLSSKRCGGAGPGCPTHVPLFSGDKSRVRITEGALKADVATVLSGTLTVGLSSVNTWRRATKVLRELGAKVVAVAFDSDWRTNKQVAGHLVSLIKRLRQRGFEVELELWDIADGKGIDDLLAAGKTPDVMQGDSVDKALEEIAKVAAATPAGTTRLGPRAIYVRPEEHEVIAEASAALAARIPDIYQRGGQLVHLVRDSRPADDGKTRPALVDRPAGAPRIAILPVAKLRTWLTQAADFVVEKHTDNGTVIVPVHPPEWLPKGVEAQAEWAGVRHLEAIAEAPFLRRDGSLMQTPGYDPASGVLYEPAEEFPPISENATRDDALRARDELLEAVVDFPFGTAVYRSVFVTALLTLLARFAFDGPSPLFFVSANVRGAGKGLLLDIIAGIAFGRHFARVAYTREDDEMRKVILSLAIEGERAVLLDNIAGTFGGPALDAALTSTWWSGRVLGKSQQIRLPLLATWYATGNNPVIGADTARRVCECRLDSPEEKPEERQGFRHPDVLGWVKSERPRLLAAALTILTAYHQAGRPDMGLTPWGSFEGWSALVRSAVVWVGLPDPGETRRELTRRADVEAAALSGLLTGWQEIDTNGEGLTTSQAITTLAAQPNAFQTLRAVLGEIYDLPAGQLPAARRLSYTLRKYVGRNAGGRCFDNRTGHGNVTVWFVRDMNRAAAATGNGGDGEDGGDSPADPSVHAHAHAHANEAGQAGNMSTIPTISTDDDGDGHGDAWEG